MVYTIGCSVGNRSTVEDCLDYFRNHLEIQVDTETTGRDPHKDKVISLQIGDSENQWFIDCRETDVLLFKDLLESKLCIIQNAKFDYKMLKASGIILDRIYDTMLAECVLYCGYDKYGYGLDKLVQRYLGVDLSKHERETFLTVGEAPFTLSQVEYGALDVTYLQQIKDKQEIKIKHYDLEYCVNLENEVVKALADIEYNGMFLDKESWNAITETQEAKKAMIEMQLDEVIMQEPLLDKLVPESAQGNLFGFEERAIKTNYASPKQIKEISGMLGYPVESTNDRELKKLVGKHKFFKILQEYRKTAKIVSTYGESFLDYINPVTGRIHTDFWQIKETGRVSSSDPNIQNLPGINLFRNCFKARPGFKWVSIDYSGQELRLMADASGETGFIDVLNRGDDLHCYAGSMMFKRPVTKADKELRNQAKTINFGKPYGMGPPKLADTLGISIEEAENLFKEYSAAFPKLNYWLDKAGKDAIKQGYSLTFAPCKRRRWYPDAGRAKELRRKGVKDKAGWKEIFMIEGQIQRNGGNSPIQGTGADITKEALVGIRNLVNRYNKEYNGNVAYLICTVHDAIDVEVLECLAEDFAKDMAEIMVACGNKYVSQVKMEVDITITDQWQK